MTKNNNLSKEEIFAYSLTLPHVTGNTANDSIDDIYARLYESKFDFNWIALEDFYYVDQDLVVFKHQKFRWNYLRIEMSPEIDQ